MDPISESHSRRQIRRVAWPPQPVSRMISKWRWTFPVGATKCFCFGREDRYNEDTGAGFAGETAPHSSHASEEKRFHHGLDCQETDSGSL